MKFTTFGIWDQEIKKLIIDISTPETINVLTNWFYSEGVLAFQKPQEIDFHGLLKASMDKYKHRPVYNVFMMRGQLLDGLNGLGAALENKLKELNIFDKQKMNAFDLFIIQGLKNHDAFISLQAEIVNEFNTWMELPGNETKTLREQGEHVCAQFMDAISAHRNLENEIEQHVKLIKEFMSQMPPDPKPMASVSKNSYFSHAIETAKDYVPTRCTIS